MLYEVGLTQGPLFLKTYHASFTIFNFQAADFCAFPIVFKVDTVLLEATKN